MMKILLICSLLFALSLCASRHKRGGQVVGGRPVTSQPQVPWMASLSMGCGGSVVGPRTILTAAHCVYKGDDKQELEQAQDLSFKVGITNLANDQPMTFQVVGGRVHREYATADGTDFDIAVLYTDQDIRHTVQPIQLISQTDLTLEPDSDVEVYGWGDTSDQGQSSDQLLTTSLRVVPQGECERAYRGQITDRMVCASLPGHDACQGDSGGPLISHDLDDGSAMQVGIVSWGGVCGDPDHPGVYTNLADEDMKDWINYYIDPEAEPKDDADIIE